MSPAARLVWVDTRRILKTPSNEGEIAMKHIKTTSRPATAHGISVNWQSKLCTLVNLSGITPLISLFGCAPAENGEECE